MSTNKRTNSLLTLVQCSSS